MGLRRWRKRVEDFIIGVIISRIIDLKLLKRQDKTIESKKIEKNTKFIKTMIYNYQKNLIISKIKGYKSYKHNLLLKNLALDNPFKNKTFNKITKLSKPIQKLIMIKKIPVIKFL